MANLRIIFWSVLPIIFAMHMPEDMEILDGYKIDALAPEIYPSEDAYFEARSLIGHQYLKPIRDKRNAKYIVYESHGLKSHFRPNRQFSHLTNDNDVDIGTPEFKAFKPNTDYMQTIDYNKLHPPPVSSEKDFADFGESRRTHNVASLRNRRETEDLSEAKKVTSIEDSVEQLPMAEKQVMNSGGGFEAEARSQSVIMDRWTKSPFEYSKVQKEEDSLAEATVNDGINARTPRVNFVTQQKKKVDSNANDSVDQNPSATKTEVYRNMPEKVDDRYYERRPPLPLYDEMPTNYRKNDNYMQPRYDR